MQASKSATLNPCKGTCKSFTRRKILRAKRYVSGFVRCKRCVIWMDHTTCHFSGGSPATPGSSGWYCNCCNTKVRMNPRLNISKRLLRESQELAGKRVAY
ncbi:MAG: hypothetical protein EB830_01100 [Nitrosopumilus sp. H13]|nr:MAG: hypothetical protein EB830_01100 [Nitrosopumilus sp. H13]